MICRKKWLQIQGLLWATLMFVALQVEAKPEHHHRRDKIEDSRHDQHDDGEGERRNQLRPKKIKSFNQLKRLLATKTMQGGQVLTPLTDVSGAVFNDSAGTAHSNTNVQVEGVDEGDVVKTDGRYIYTISNGKVRIVQAYPATAMAISATLTFDTGFSPIELYVNGGQLIVIGSDWQSDTGVGNQADVPQDGQAEMAIWGGWGESRTLVKIYDLADHANPALLREIAVTGNYLSSRKIGNDMYLVGRKYPNYYFRFFAEPTATDVGNLAMTPENTLPSVSDTAVANGTPQLLPVSDIYFFPGFVEPDYVTVAGIKLNALDQAADVKAYLGGGDTVYASSSHLYLSAADYSNHNPADQSISAPFTHLYKFALAQGGVTFDGAGEVDGTPLNQFSMDEHNGYFRIATTVDQWTQTGNTGISQTWNNLYTLDSNMNVVGRLEHLADGERIYSARFIGDRSYLVTFKQVDPLFVIDLSIPQAPTVLGELKIPGFSNYLHPFDENHLIGFGQDTEDLATGATVTSGMKLALFDVSDVAHPAQLHSLTTGVQGTYSPLQYDHKALLFDKSRSLLGFPISITAQKPGDEWPMEIFQGAQVYKVSLADGFQKQAAISHQPSGQNYDWYSYVNRLLTIGDQLYTLSEAHLQANDLAGYALTGKLDFPIEQPPVACALATASRATTDSSDIAIDCPVLIDPVVMPSAQ